MSAFSLVDENADFVVLNKAAGVSFHSEACEGLVVLAQKQLGIKLYAVHRLDKVTSGLILLAKSSEAAAKLTELFSTQQIQKYYLALSNAKPVKKQGWVKGDMVQGRRAGWKLLESQVKPAVTYFISQGFTDLPFRAFLVKPYSGKTHQIRVALKSQGAPILGDVQYQAEDADRVYLHAYALCFSFNGRVFEYVQAPTQGECFLKLVKSNALDVWQAPWLLTWPTYSLPKQVS